MACLMKFGSLPSAKDPDNTTPLLLQVLMIPMPGGNTLVIKSYVE
jgi:hypothetical protein